MQQVNSPRPLLVTGLCLAANIFDGYDVIVYGSAVPALLDHPAWHLTPQQAGAIGSLTLLGMFAGAIASGALTDRFGRRATYIGCLAWFSIAMLLVAVAPTPETLGLFRFLAGLGFGGVGPTSIALVIEHAPPHRRSFYNAIMLCGFPAGGVLAALLAIAVLPDGGFRILFALGGLPLITLVPLALKLLPESPAFRRRTGPRTPVTWRGRAAVAVALLALANFCGLLIAFALNTWLPQLMRQAGYELAPALVFLLLLNAGAVVGGLAGARIADRAGGRRVTTIAFLAAAATIGVLAVPLPSVALQLMVFVAGAATIGAQMVLFGYTATHFAPAGRATALGVATGVGRLGAAAGPLLVGYLIAAHAGLAWNFGLFAVVALAGAVLSVAVPVLRASTSDSAATISVRH